MQMRRTRAATRPAVVAVVGVALFLLDRPRSAVGLFAEPSPSISESFVCHNECPRTTDGSTRECEICMHPNGSGETCLVWPAEGEVKPPPCPVGLDYAQDVPATTAEPMQGFQITVIDPPPPSTTTDMPPPPLPPEITLTQFNPGGPSPPATTMSAPMLFCTADAKKCPDGSYVGRDGSNGCEFYPCPSPPPLVNPPPPVFCTEDAKICPDGVSSVGRDPSNDCEFYPCPPPSSVNPLPVVEPAPIHLCLCPHTKPDHGMWYESKSACDPAAVPSSAECPPVDLACPPEDLMSRGMNLCDHKERCAYGKESCCGQTYDSLVCECFDDGSYGCYYTDACMMPPCEPPEFILGPPLYANLCPCPDNDLRPEEEYFVIQGTTDDDLTCPTDPALVPDGSCPPPPPVLVAPVPANTACPVDRWADPGESCAHDGDCRYGSETCCGVTHDSFVCQCSGGKAGGVYACFYTDACMGAYMPGGCAYTTSTSPTDVVTTEAVTTEAVTTDAMTTDAVTTDAMTTAMVTTSQVPFSETKTTDPPIPPTLPPRMFARPCECPGSYDMFVVEGIDEFDVECPTVDEDYGGDLDAFLTDTGCPEPLPVDDACPTASADGLWPSVRDFSDRLCTHADSCRYGREVCCGQEHDSFVCSCTDKGYYACLFTDACMMALYQCPEMYEIECECPNRDPDTDGIIYYTITYADAPSGVCPDIPPIPGAGEHCPSDPMLRPPVPDPLECDCDGDGAYETLANSGEDCEMACANAVVPIDDKDGDHGKGKGPKDGKGPPGGPPGRTRGGGGGRGQGRGRGQGGGRGVRKGGGWR